MKGKKKKNYQKKCGRGSLQFIQHRQLIKQISRKGGQQVRIKAPIEVKYKDKAQMNIKEK